MRRKLLLLNVVLVGLIVAGLWWFRAEFRRARERYGNLHAAAKAPRSGRPASAPPPGPVQPASFFDAADKFLFSADRNPTVVIEPPKVKPRPALPQLFGVMQLDGEPVTIMAAGPSSPHKTIRPGENIGEFKLVAAAGGEITFEWDGQQIKSQVADLLVRNPEPPPSNAGRPAVPAPAAPNQAAGATVLNPTGGAEQRGEYKIGPAVQGASGTIYQAMPGDTAPDGFIQGNRRKVVRSTPFGSQAWWEEVK